MDPPGRPTERARFLRPPALDGVEALHATFVRHRYTAHIHDALTIAHVDRGAATFDLEGSRHVAPAGTAFLIPPQAVHTGEPVTSSGYTYRVLYLDPGELAARSDEAIAPSDLSRTPIVVRWPVLARALRRMHATLVGGGRSLESGEALLDVAGAVRRVVGHDPLSPLRFAHPAVRRARDFIHGHWREDFTLDDLARAAGGSPFHVARTFRAQVGMPPTAYRRALRVQAAQRLLREGQDIATVAADCGFYDQSHLNRHFRRATGVTPGRYAAAR